MRFNMMDFEAEPARESSVEYARPGGIVSGAGEVVKPAYEVRDPVNWQLRAAIYADGRAKGLPLGVTVNRIPKLIALARAEEAKPEPAPKPEGGWREPFCRDAMGRMWVRDDLNLVYREVVYK